MFFVGIFGIDNKEKIVKEIQKLYCRECNGYGLGKVIKRYDFFHFFFIPIFKWNEKYYVIYNNCNHVYSISKEKGKSIEQGEEVEINYWDLKDLGVYDYDINGNKNNKCLNCGREIEAGYTYCPYCGQKLR